MLMAASTLFLSCSEYGFFWGQFGAKDVDERSPRLSEVEPPDLQAQSGSPSARYSILIISDTHYGAEREDLDEDVFLAWLRSWYEESDGTKCPRFAVNLGDTADGGKKEQFASYLEFERKIKAVAGEYLYGETEETPDDERRFRIYSVLGNHDLYHDGQGHFMRMIYPHTSSYFFSLDTDPDGGHSGFSFYFLDTANGTAGTSQLDDFKSKIKADPRPKIVFTHYPVYAGGSNMLDLIQDTMERNTLLTSFARNKVGQVYEGHAHKNYGFEFKGFFREDVIGSLRFSGLDAKQCAIVTIDEAEASVVSTEIIKYADQKYGAKQSQ